MKTLNGVLAGSDLDIVASSTRLRFKDANEFKTPEALIIYEQRLLTEDALLDCCCREYNMRLETPKCTYIPPEVVEHFKDTGAVPLSYSTRDSMLTIGVLPEKDVGELSYRHMLVKKVYVPIYYYVNIYTRYYGHPRFLAELATADKFNFIVSEAVNTGAVDITMVSNKDTASVYYNIKKQKVHSKRTISKDDLNDLVHFIADRAGSPMTDDEGVMPRHLSINLDIHNRGRVEINHTYYGWMVTIRVLPDENLDKTLEDLNLDPNAIDFIRGVVLSKNKGLRLFIGETCSGKNTTILASLLELTHKDTYKIVSIENPVEILVDGIEQISVETEEEFVANTASTLRQNPDIVYIAEITNYTAQHTMTISNTGKVVFSSIHANSISDVVARLTDIANMSSDRVLLCLQSCVYQELKYFPEEDRVRPINRCLEFTDELKSRLYGKSLGEIKTILQGEEAKWKTREEELGNGNSRQIFSNSL